MMEIAAYVPDMLAKVAAFLVVQALVYLILSNSSEVFSKDKKLGSLSFKPARSLSIRGILAAFSDVPQAAGGGEPSPRSSSSIAQSTPVFEDLPSGCDCSS
ncbi:uncharacterized protein LOC115732857 [Rhodamnia argentea]|uniref:Uncharacterized protein LOC115732857 n=1 Tax=Rhodamnia argentea TaxID=178133 RepID=A0A8B8NAD7_9MYRT|nr:uncharacterized protein LOC115732857 [Rhodamnia argentea]